MGQDINGTSLLVSECENFIGDNKKSDDHGNNDTNVKEVWKIQLW